jgi:endoglucanase Acf2
MKRFFLSLLGFSAFANAQSATLQLGQSLALIQPEAVSGFNFGNMMNIVENQKALQALNPKIVRFPAGNVGDDQDLNASSMRIFGINLKLLEQKGVRPKVIVQTRAFQGFQNNGKNRAEDAAEAARLAIANKIKVDYWSIGNEPNLYAVTRGDKSWTPEKYCQTFKAHRAAILKVQPSAKFAGPSTTGDAGFLENFVRLCGDQIDILTWHVYPTDGRASHQAAIDTIARVDNEREQYMTLWKDPVRNPLAYQKDIGFGLTEYGLSYRTESNRHIADQLAGLWAAETTLRMASAGATLNTYFALQGIGGHGTLDISGVPRATYYAFRHLQHFAGQAMKISSSNPNIWLNAAQKDNLLTVMAINPFEQEQALETNIAGWQLIGIKGFTDAVVQAETPDLALKLEAQVALPAQSFWRLVYRRLTTAQKPNVPLALQWREGNYRAPPEPEFKTARYAPPYPTNAWWGSLLWEKFSGALMAQPLALQATPSGMALNYPRLEVGDEGFATPFSPQVTVGLEGVVFPDARVDGASDFVVRTEFKQQNHVLHSTFGRGLPFAWFKSSGKPFKLSFLESPQTWALPCQGIPCNARGLRFGERDYVVFSSNQTSWRETGREILISSKDLIIAALPEEAQQNPDLRLSATAFLAIHTAIPSNSKVSWQYLRTSSQVRTTHQLETGSLMGLYPHQWKNSQTKLEPWSYISSRGQIRLAATNSFETNTIYTGILPNLPISPDVAAQTELRTALLEFVALKRFFPLSPESIRITDSYTDARNFGRLTQMLEVADQLREKEAAQTILNAMKERLDEWFDPAPPHALLWDGRWGTLIPVPASHGADYQLNDHHFNFGYFLQAAASIAERDATWFEKNRVMLDVMAREMAAWDNDPSFTKHRNFDAYVGHSWASGDNRGRLRGANQESSSEAVNAWAGLIRYAQASQNAQLLERGIGMYALETEAVWQYWFSAGDNFPTLYPKTTLGILWGNGGEYNTWWTNSRGAIHLIQTLPLTGSSLYLARDTAFVEKNFAMIGDQRYFNDLSAMYLALANPERGYTLWNQDLRPEFGNSLTQTKNWFSSLRFFGTPVQSITANVPQYAVFQKNNSRTYVAYNPDSQNQTATFSDGTTLSMPAHQYAQIQLEVKP